MIVHKSTNMMKVNWFTPLCLVCARLAQPTAFHGAALEFIRIWRNILVVAHCATLAVDRPAESVERRAFLNRATAFATFQREALALTR